MMINLDSPEQFEEIFWNTMEDLKTKGASSILVIPIEKMMD